jgi:TolB-like protein
MLATERGSAQIAKAASQSREKIETLIATGGGGMIETARFRLQLLGTFGLFAPDGARIAVTSRKGMALIALVAMARSGERSRGWLQDQLWGSRAPDQARASLRRELANLRVAINPDAGTPLITADSMRVRLDLGRIDVDVRLLDRDVANARTPSFTDLGELLEGLDIAGEDGFEDWLREQRQHVRELVEQFRVQDWERAALAPTAPDVASAVAPGDSPAGATHTPLPAPRKPSVAVLAFSGRSSDAGDAVMAQIMTEEIGDALARFSTLYVVIAAATSAAWPIDHGKLGRELGVRYLLDGSVQRSADALRVTARLTDGILREQLWTQAFDAPLADVFALQADIARTVAQQIDSSVEIAERARAIVQPVATPDAYQLYWRANALFRRWEPGAMREAIGLSEQVLQLEPDNAWASALAAFCHAVSYSFHWSADRAATRRAALDHYEHCLRNGAGDPFVLGYAAGTLVGIDGDILVADQLIERALVIHPASAASLFWGGWVDVARANPARGLVRFELALRINPRSAVRPHALTGAGLCLLALGRLAESRDVLNEAVQYLSRLPVTVASLVLVNELLGNAEEAGHYVGRLRDLGGIEAVRSTIRDPAFGALLGQAYARYA